MKAKNRPRVYVQPIVARRCGGCAGHGRPRQWVHSVGEYIAGRYRKAGEVCTDCLNEPSVRTDGNYKLREALERVLSGEYELVPRPGYSLSDIKIEKRETAAYAVVYTDEPSRKRVIRCGADDVLSTVAVEVDRARTNGVQVVGYRAVVWQFGELRMYGHHVWGHGYTDHAVPA